MKQKLHFQQYDTIWSFGDNIYTGKINIGEAKMDQSNLLNNWEEFSETYRSRTKEGKYKTRNTFESVVTL